MAMCHTAVGRIAEAVKKSVGRSMCERGTRRQRCQYTIDINQFLVALARSGVELGAATIFGICDERVRWKGSMKGFDGMFDRRFDTDTELCHAGRHHR